MRGCARFAAVLALIGAAAAAAAAAPMNPILVGSLVGGNPRAIVVQGHYALRASAVKPLPAVATSAPVR